MSAPTPLRPKLRVPISAYVVDCAVYVDGLRLPGQWTHDRALAEVRRRGEGFVWIGLHEPDTEQITGIADAFGLHELAVEDAVHAHQRPKLERYDDTLFMVLKTVCYVGHGDPTTASEIVATGEVMVFVGADFVVTVRHGEHSGLREVRRRLEADPEQLALGLDFVDLFVATGERWPQTRLLRLEHAVPAVFLLMHLLAFAAILTFRHTTSPWPTAGSARSWPGSRRGGRPSRCGSASG